jgi:hypothetical protein
LTAVQTKVNILKSHHRHQAKISAAEVTDNSSLLMYLEPKIADSEEGGGQPETFRATNHICPHKAHGAHNIDLVIGSSKNPSPPRFGQSPNSADKPVPREL